MLMKLELLEMCSYGALDWQGEVGGAGNFALVVVGLQVQCRCFASAVLASGNLRMPNKSCCGCHNRSFCGCPALGLQEQPALGQ